MKKRPRTQCPNNELYERIHNELKDMYFLGELTDVDLCNGDKKISAHRVVLAAASPYFKAMFSSGMEESNKREIHLPSIDTYILEIIIQYMYSGELNINGDNVMALLEISNLFEMVDIVSQCCCKLIEDLNVENCLHIRDYAEKFSTRSECAKLFSAADAYLQNYFLDICQTNAYYSLEFNSLFCILKKHDLCVIKEEYVVYAVLGWINHDVMNRIQYASELISSCVEISLLPKMFLEELAKTEPILRSLMKSNQFNLNDFSTNKLSRRNGIPTVYAIGGCNGRRASRSIEVFDAVRNEWKLLGNMKEKRSYFGSTVVDEKIYVIGGHNDNNHLNSVERYDPATNQWKHMKPMEEVRSYLGAVTLNGLIYAIGGYDGDFHTDTVECFDPAKEEWKSVASLNVRRSGLAATVLNGYIYVVGGFDGQSHLNSMERYDPETNIWTEMPNMIYVRNGPGAVPLDGYLHVIGGEYKHGKRIRAAERYDPNTKEWKEISSMEECTSGHGVTVMNDMFMFALGGSNQDNKYLRTAYRYDVLSKSWQAIASMQEMRCGLSVIVVHTQITIPKYLKKSRTTFKLLPTAKKISHQYPSEGNDANDDMLSNNNDNNEINNNDNNNDDDETISNCINMTISA